MLLGCCIERAAQVYYLAVDVEAVDGVDAQGEALKRILLDTACGSGKDGYIHIVEFADVLHDRVGSQLRGAVGITIAAYHAYQFHIGCCFQCLQGILAYVAISYDGYSNLFHLNLY